MLGGRAPEHHTDVLCAALAPASGGRGGGGERDLGVQRQHRLHHGHVRATNARV